MTLTVWLDDGMVTVLVVPVLASLFVPLQPTTCQPAAGVAVRLMLWPAVYCPVPQPADEDGADVGLLPWPV